MNTSLAVLLPVYNSQQRLTTQVGEMLEVLAGLTGDFRMSIVDDHSTDESWDVARDLVAQFPQLVAARHPKRQGLAETISAAARRDDFHLAILSEDTFQLDPQDLRVLWQLRQMERRLARPTIGQAIDSQTWQKLRSGKAAGTIDHRGWLVLRRETCDQFRLEQTVDSLRRVDRSAATAPAAPRIHLLGTPAQSGGSYSLTHGW